MVENVAPFDLQASFAGAVVASCWPVPELVAPQVVVDCVEGILGLGDLDA